MVAWAKVTLAFAVDPQARRAGEEQDPFIMVLIIGFVCWHGLTGRDVRSIRTPLRESSSVTISSGA